MLSGGSTMCGKGERKPLSIVGTIRGADKWGFMPSMAYSLDVGQKSADKSEPGGVDWLREGTSRAQVASKIGEDILAGSSDIPAWLTRQRGGRLEAISDRGTVAQV